jgi:hypothetical protein
MTDGKFLVTNTEDECLLDWNKFEKFGTATLFFVLLSRLEDFKADRDLLCLL